MYLGVKEVKPIDNYKLILTFGNNEVKIFDMIPYLDKMIFPENRSIMCTNGMSCYYPEIRF